MSPEPRPDPLEAVMDGSVTAVVLQFLQSAPGIILSATIAAVLWQSRDVLSILLRRVEGFEGFGVRISLAALRDAAKEKGQSRMLEANDRRELERELRIGGHRLRGTRVLWVDDRPSNNYYEAEALLALGAKVMFAASTQEVEHLLFERQGRFDLIISDWSRPESADAGPMLLRSIRERGNETPFLFYAGIDRPLPEGAQGLATHPAQLIELVLRNV